MKIEIRKIRREDPVEGFECGEAELDLFLKRYARQNQFRHYIGVTYVAVDGGEILGFVTLSAGSVNREELPKERQGSLPAYALPILRLSRLAVDRRRQGRGIGRALLRFALRMALRQREAFGCYGVLVDAKADATGFYEAYGFEPIRLLAGRRDIRPRPVEMFLATKVIERAMGN